MAEQSKFPTPRSGMFSRAWERTRKALRRFRADRTGAVVLLFGLTLIPVLGFVGGAIDYANAYRTRAKIQNALDSAALAAGREIDMGANEGAAQQTAMNVFQANLGPDFPAGYSVTFNFEGDTVTANASMSVDTKVLGVLGIETFPVGATATVGISGGTLEVALVLDNSGSMGGSKIRDLRDAAKRLTEILFESDRTGEGVKMSVVPFAAAVNVGSNNANASWMDRTGESSIHFENFDEDITRWDLFDAMRNTSWAGCVEVRPSPHDVTDSAPTGGDSLFVPMFAPDEPDDWSYNNSYLDDDGGDCSGGGRRGGRGGRGGESDEEKQEKTCKYMNERPSGGQGPNYRCDPRPILALTNNRSQIDAAIDAMDARGNTNIMEGVAWGWRTLSPGEPFSEGLPYDEPDNRKFMIVMTDGANTHNGSHNQNMSYYSAWGYAKNGRLRSPTNSTWQLVEEMNDDTLEACNNTKASEITVFTIAFDVDDQDTRQLLLQCASGESRAFSIDNGDALIAVFEAIANEINRLRITS